MYSRQTWEGAPPSQRKRQSTQDRRPEQIALRSSGLGPSRNDDGLRLRCPRKRALRFARVTIIIIIVVPIENICGILFSGE